MHKSKWLKVRKVAKTLQILLNMVLYMKLQSEHVDTVRCTKYSFFCVIKVFIHTWKQTKQTSS